MLETWQTAIRNNMHLVRGFFWMIAGSSGRLVVSLAYFLAVANTLSIGTFGLFATTSATGVVLSRLLAFGFVSPLYRVATVKPRLLGTYTAGFLAGAALSVPLIMLITIVIYLMVFSGDMSFGVFAALIAAEVFLWRACEIVIIVLNGTGRFGAGAFLSIFGIALRAGAALIFAASGSATLAVWSLFYLGANAVAAMTAIAVFFPKRRLRWRSALYLRRWNDAVSVAGAEVLFYVQSELDKILVLSIAGPQASGIYAIIMRLVDLTGLPVRAFNTILVQKLMRSAALLQSLSSRVLLETAIAAVSVAGLLALAGVLAFFPTALGSNIGEAAPYVILVVAAPVFRNLVEYHSELLYATGRTVARTVNLAIVGATKAALLSAALIWLTQVSGWVPALNGVFLAAYAVSAVLTYRALARTTRKAI